MHGAFQLGKRPDILGSHLEIHVLLEPFGGNHIPQKVDHLFTLGGHLHLGHGSVEQVAPVLGRRGPDVIRVSQGKQLHGNQPSVRIHKKLPDVGKVRHAFAVKDPVAGVGDGFVKCMGTDADGRPAQVVFAHIDGVQGRVPGIAPPGEDVFFANGIPLQGILGHIVLGADHVFNQIVVLVPGVCHEEHIFIGLRVLAKGRHQGSLVGVADVVFAAVGHILAFPQGCQGHFAGVKVGAVCFFRQAKGKNTAILQKFGGLYLYGLVIAHPDGAQAENGHLPGVPIRKAVKPQNFVEGTVSVGVPPAIVAAVC